VTRPPSGFLLLILDGCVVRHANFLTSRDLAGDIHKGRYSGRMNGEIKDLQRGIR